MLNLPGYKNVYGPLITPEQAHDILLYEKPGDEAAGPAGKNAALVSKSTKEACEELESLVRGLDNDPDLIYAFVYNNIRYTPIFGDMKGVLNYVLS